MIADEPTAARIPPQNLEAEASVLGAVLLDAGAIARALEQVAAEDFYREGHRAVFRAAAELFRRGDPVDQLTVAAELERAGLLNQVGGRAHLAVLSEGVPTAANVEHHARIVRDRALRRRVIVAGGAAAAVGHDDSLSGTEALGRAAALFDALAGDGAGTEMATLGELLEAAMERIEAQIAAGGRTSGVPTGFEGLDRLTNGLRPSDLVIVAGRPSMGKTSFGLGAALHVAVEHRTPVAIWSLEMGREQIVERILCERARVDAQRLHRGMLSEAEYDRLVATAGPLGQARVLIDDTPVLDDLTLRLRARQARSRHGIGLIVVDYLQLMHARVAKGDGNRVQEVSAISRALKGIARELNIPVLAISQLSRAPESRNDKRPHLSDLRDSGALEQDADLVVFLYRDEYYHREKSEKPGTVEVIVAKHRNGPTGTIEMRFEKQWARFESLERRRPGGMD